MSFIVIVERLDFKIVIYFFLYFQDESRKSIVEPWKEKDLLQKFLPQIKCPDDQAMAILNLVDLGYSASRLIEIITKFHLYREEKPDLELIAQEIKKISVFNENGFSTDEIFEGISSLDSWNFPQLIHTLTQTKGNLTQY